MTTAAVSSCGSYASWEDIQIEVEGNVDVRYLADEDLSPSSICGASQRIGEIGPLPDLIEIVKAGERPNCDDHRVETVYHEIGHLLGFYHVTSATSLATQDLFHDPRKVGWAQRTIKAHHLRVLVEQYD